MYYGRLVLTCLGVCGLGGLLTGCDLPGAQGGGFYTGGGTGYGGGYHSRPSSYDEEDERRPLRILDASWRADNGRGSNVTAVIRGDCDGQQECRIRADNRYFGDPSPGHVKRLIVGYRCGRDRLEFVVPENKTQTLSCRG